MKSHKKLVFLLYDKAVDHYSRYPLVEPFEKDVCSHLSLIKGLLKYFSLDDIGFYTPDRLLQGQSMLTIKGNRFVETDQPLSADTLLIFSRNNCSPRFSQDYVKRQFEAYHGLTDRVGELVNHPSMWDKVDKKAIYGFGHQFFPELLDSSSWGAVEQALRSRGEAVLKHRTGAGGAEVYLLTPQNLSEMRRRVNGTLDDHILQKRLHPQREKRLYFIGGELCGSMVRELSVMPWDNAGWYSYEDSRTRSYIPSAQELQLAQQLYAYLNLDFGTVDFIDTEDGTLVVEANMMSPGLVGHSCLQDTPVYDLGDRFAQYLYERQDRKAKKDLSTIIPYAAEASLISV